MSIFSKIFTANPNASDPAVAAAAGITRNRNGVLQQRRTSESDQLAHNLGIIAGTAWTPVMEGMLVPQVTYSAIPRSLQYNPAMPTVLNRAQHVLRPTTSTIAKTTIPSVVNTGRRGLAGTIALGVAAGQGATSPSQRNRSTLTVPNKPSKKSQIYSNPTINIPKNTVLDTVLDSNYLYDYKGKPSIRRKHPIRRKSAINNGFKEAWTNARNSGLATFTYNGNLYNTMKKGETQQQYNAYLANFAKRPAQNFVGDLKPSDLGSLTTINPQALNTNIEL